MRTVSSIQFQRIAIADANYVATIRNWLLVYTSITAPRTVTLPLASAKVGQILKICDESGLVSATNYIRVAPSGADTINGLANYDILVAYGHVEVMSTGTKWIIVSSKEAPRNAEYLTLSASNELTNERVFTTGRGLSGTILASTYTPYVDLNTCRAYYEHFEDFMQYSATSHFVTASIAGVGGTAAAGTGTAANPGILRLNCANVNSRSAIVSAVTAVSFGGGAQTFEALLNLSALSSATETYSLRAGYLDSLTATDETDGAYFEYLSTTSVNWQYCTANNSTRTKTASTTAVAAGAWIRLRIDVNAAGTSVSYYVNDILIGTLVANIPTAAGRETGFGIVFCKTASAANVARSCNVDYLYVRSVLTTSR